MNLNRGLTLEGYLERLRQIARNVRSTRRRIVALHEEGSVVRKTMTDTLKKEVA